MNLNSLKGIAGKIAIGYCVIIAMSLVIMFSIIFVIKQIRETDNELSNSTLPTYVLLKDLKKLSTTSFKLTSNWVYKPSQHDKEALMQLLLIEYPFTAEKLTAGAETSRQKDEKILTLLNEFDKLVALQKEVTKKLQDQSLYENDVAVKEAAAILTKKITPSFESFSERVDELINVKQGEMTTASLQKENFYLVLTLTIIMSCLFYIAVGIIASVVSVKTIVTPINNLKKIILELGRGEINDVKLNSTRDEIGEMVDALGNLISGLKSNTQFAIEIGEGKYESSFTPLSTSDQMGNALLQMRSNLKKNTQEDAKRTWAMTGLAQAGEILRKTDQSSQRMYDQIIQFMVEYLAANQGCLFTLQDEDPDDVHLKMSACYAFSRKKYAEQRVAIDEGLVGQCFLEKEPIYIAKVPATYIHITSGLGGSVPQCVLIVPLKVNEEIQAIAEIASFKTLEKYEIDFAIKLGESVASYIKSSKTTDRTTLLLEDLQIQSETMRSQEEEMRQNMEELSAIQEEMIRNEKSYINKINLLESQVKKLSTPSTAPIERNPVLALEEMIKSIKEDDVKEKDHLTAVQLLESKLKKLTASLQHDNQEKVPVMGNQKNS